MKDCCPKEMPRTVKSGDSGGGGKIITKDEVRHMPRKAGSLTLNVIRRAGSVELKRTSWRHKSKPDPKEVEYKNMLSGMGFANL